ncbi:MAG: multiple sugar transport system substrate-binding protein [Chloroflexi bacterium]|nr:MAG: multiple sugar transport system substrate-binding protein [Chloroflexota bacterium]
MKARFPFIILSVLIVMSIILGACAKVATPEAPADVTVAPNEVVVTEAPIAEPVTIKYWHTMSDAEAAKLNEVISAFESANAGISVQATRYAWSDFKTALLTAIAGGDVPDTVRMDIAWVSEFASQGALMQLDGFLPDFDAIAASVFPGPLSTNKWDGHYYGLPQNTNTQVLVYNKAAFEAAGIASAPATIEEFVADACALTDTAKGTYGFAEGGTYFWAPAPLFYAMGGKIVDDGITTATGYVNSAESVAAFTMLKDLYDKGCMSPNLLGGGIATDAGQGTGIYAMIIDGPWMVDIYKNNYPELQFEFALIPAGATGTSSVVGGEDVVILDGSKNKEAAAKWVSYLMSVEAQKALAQVGVIPTISSLAGDPDLPAHFGIFMEQLKTAQARVPSPKWSDMDNAINNAYQRILNGDQTPQEALDQAATEINALIAQ